jgi:antitoxin ParD1/3/4
MSVVNSKAAQRHPLYKRSVERRTRGEVSFLPSFKIENMETNTSVSLGTYFESFVENKVAEGRYENVSEVIRAGLRLLEEEEDKLSALKRAVEEGINSGIEDGFNPESHLLSLKAAKRNG